MESNHESLPWTTNKVSSMYSHVQVCWWIMFLVVMLTYIWREPNVPYAQRLATTEILFIHRKREVEHNTKKRNSTQEVNVENPKLGGKTTAAHRLQTVTMYECTKQWVHGGNDLGLTIFATGGDYNRGNDLVSLSLCTVTHSLFFLHQQEKWQQQQILKVCPKSYLY